MAPEEPQSRLDREIDEILAKKSREPTPFASHPRAPKSTPDLHGAKTSAIRVWNQLLAMPLLLAFVLGFAGRLVHDLSPLLALVLFTGAVAAIWVPGVLRLTRRSVPATGNVKYWRGRPYTSNVRDVVSRSPIDSIKRYFDRRR